MATIRQKTGGRIAGTPNRLTTQVRTLLTCVLEQEIENLPELLKEVSPNVRLTAVLKLAELLCPANVHWVKVLEGFKKWELRELGENSEWDKDCLDKESIEFIEKNKTKWNWMY